MKKRLFSNHMTARTAITLILVMLTSIRTWADITYTATDGTPGVKTAENYDMLVDGKKDTKWCVTSLGSPTFIEFHTSEAIVPKGYVLTTGNDTGNNPGRNPKSWTIMAKKNSNDSWTTIASVTNDTSMPAANTTDFTYAINNTQPYQYFRFEISAIQSGTTFQLAEFAFLTSADASDFTKAIVNGIMPFYPYTGSPITLNFVVKDVAGNTLTKDTDYTATITKDGNVTSVVKDEGSYTLTLTGMGNYSGEQVIYFAVGDGIAVTASTTAMTNNIYKVYENVQIDSRIQINGIVTLILGEGTTLNANQGIEIANGNTLVIEGPGTLNATAADTKSAIGAQFIGTITINGGTINATTTGSGAGIGGDRNSYCNENSIITINGGIVNAKAGSTASAIGGGWRYWAGDYGMPGTIIINGGQVTATGKQGIGKGASATGTGSSLILGWTNSETDFIDSANYNVDNISFTKPFMLDGTEEIATEDNINGKKIVPYIINIANSTINGLQDLYTYTGSPIDINYTVTYEGHMLTEGTDYIATITKDAEVTNVIEEGVYTLTLTGMDNFKGTLTLNFEVTSIPELISGGFIFDDGQATNWASKEGPNSLVDGNLNTKYGISNADPWVEFHYKLPIPVKSYALWTANDQDGKRNPRSWTIKAKNNVDDSWTTLTTVDNSNGDKLPMANNTRTIFYINNDKVYKYFRFEATRASNGEFQLAELQLCTRDLTSNLAYATISGLKNSYDYTGDAIDISYAVTAFDGTVLTKDIDYTATITKDGNTVNEVKNDGTYKLTIVGKGNYSGSNAITFNVVNYVVIGGEGTIRNVAIPTSSSDNYSFTEQIFTAAEFGRAGAILSINFINLGEPCNRYLDIYMVSTTKNSFDNNDDWVQVTDADKVFSGKVSFKQGDWTTIDLDKYFTYDGENNVVIAVNDKTGNTEKGSLTFYSFSASEQAIFVRRGDVVFDPSAIDKTGYVTPYKNRIRFDMASLNNIPLVKPSGLKRTGCTASTTTLCWTERGNATAWQICLNDDEDNFIETTTSSYTLTHLTTGKTYSAKVRSISGDKRSNWSNPIHFIPAGKPIIGNSTGSSNYLPSNTNYYNYSISQQIYTADEICMSGTITSIDFYNLGDEITRNFDIYFVTTNRTYFYNNENWITFTAANKVFSGNVKMLKDDWTVIDFDTHFEYDGTSNIAIIICDNTGAKDNSLSCRTYSSEISQANYNISENNSFNPGSSLGSGRKLTEKNQIRLGFTNTIPRPDALVCSNNTATTATLSWTENGTANTWQICLDGDETNPITADSNPFTITGLTTDKEYIATVRSVTDNGESAWSNKIPFEATDKRRIGFGNATESEIPIDNYSKYSLSQQIYSATEIGMAGTITSIDFYNYSAGTTRNLDIYLVHTDKTSFNSKYDWILFSASDKVFSGNVSVVKDNWTSINFDNSFIYDGISNLAVIVYDHTGTNNSNNLMYFRVMNTAVSQAIVETDDEDFDFSCLAYNGRQLNTKNQIRLGISPASQVTFIPRPTNLVCTATTTTATLNWTENGTATVWQICLNDDEDNLIEVDTNPHTFTNLTAEATYTVKIRAVTNNGHSSWSDKIRFDATEKICIGGGYGWDDYLPTTTFSDYSMSQQIYTAEELGEAGYIQSIDFMNLYNNITRKLDIYMVHTTKSTFENGTDWVSVTAADKVFSGNVSFQKNAWATIILDTPFYYDGQSNIALMVYDNTGSYIESYFSVYDAESQAIYCWGSRGYDPTSPETGSVWNYKNTLRLRIIHESITTVPKPTSLTCTGYTDTTSTLSWIENGTAKKWQICLNDDEDNLILVTDNPYTLVGLISEKIYTAKVRAVTDEGESNWSDVVSFTPSNKKRIGSGMDYSEYLPTYTSACYSLTQQIYTAQELGKAGSILSIAFCSMDADYTRNLDVYMVNTTRDIFDYSSGYFSIVASDKVFSGEVTFKPETWTTIPLDVPFVYDGKSNVVLVVYDHTGNYSGRSHFYTFSADRQARLIARDEEIDLSNLNSYSIFTQEEKSQILLDIVPLGDANGDGSVSITDAVAIVNYILTNGNPTGNFVFSAADMNGDKEITISDAMGIVNRILTGE